LNEEEDSEERDRGGHPHGQGDGGRRKHPREHNSPGAESVGRHAPQQLSRSVGDAEGDVDVARQDRRESDRRVLEHPELGNREPLAREVEPCIGEPGDAEDPPAPSLV